MALPQNRRNSALRVAFLTDFQFGKLAEDQQQNLKKRAIRCIERQVRYPVVENSAYPDIVLKIIRREDGDKGWMLRKSTQSTRRF